MDIINESNNHLTAEQIYLKMCHESCKVAMATVYNNLNLLYSQGLIRKITVDNSPDHYDKLIRHDHLICKKCGKISDLFLEDLTAKLEKETGIKFDSYDLKLLYICDECKQKDTTDIKRC